MDQVTNTAKDAVEFGLNPAGVIVDKVKELYSKKVEPERDIKEKKSKNLPNLPNKKEELTFDQDRKNRNSKPKKKVEKKRKKIESIQLPVKTPKLTEDLMPKKKKKKKEEVTDTSPTPGDKSGRF